MSIPSGAASAIVFTAREPTDADRSLTIKIDTSDGNDQPTADITLSYGSTFEKFRGVSLDLNSENFIETLLGTTLNRPNKPARFVSSLVTVTPPPGGFPAKFKNTPATHFQSRQVTPLLARVMTIRSAITSAAHGLIDDALITIVGGQRQDCRQWSQKVKKGFRRFFNSSE